MKIWKYKVSLYCCGRSCAILVNDIRSPFGWRLNDEAIASIQWQQGPGTAEVADYMVATKENLGNLFADMSPLAIMSYMQTDGNISTFATRAATKQEQSDFLESIPEGNYNKNGLTKVEADIQNAGR